MLTEDVVSPYGAQVCGFGDGHDCDALLLIMAEVEQKTTKKSERSLKEVWTKGSKQKNKRQKNCYLSVRVLSALSGTIQRESRSKLIMLSPNKWSWDVTLPKWDLEPRHDCGVYRQTVG